VFGWGTAESGALGMRLSNSCSPFEIRFDLNHEVKVKDIFCGPYTSFFLTGIYQINNLLLVTGEIFGCGINDQGQLGSGVKSLKEY
jgi:alpha-tubulin suppressor-like RCC1 family protein